MNQNTKTSWVVMKYGGSSVSAASNWPVIASRVDACLKEGENVLLVMSALTGVTNLLEELAGGASPDRTREILLSIDDRHHELASELGIDWQRYRKEFTDELASLASSVKAASSPDDKALLIAQGEFLSSALARTVLEDQGIEIQWQDARTLLFADENCQNPLSATCPDHADPDLQAWLAGQGRVHITQGFLAGRPGGGSCLLGRGGSDTSAACLAARLQAVRLEIWTDVPGMFSADPKVVQDARLLENLSYSEAQELASMGARVLHPPSIQPVRRHRIPIFIRDSFNPEVQGTRIGLTGDEETAQVKGVVSRDGITLINMESASMWRQSGFLADVFAVFKRHGLSVDLISTSESTVTVSLDPGPGAPTHHGELLALQEELSSFCDVSVKTCRTSISLVGNSIRTILGRLSAALDVFQDRKVHMVTQSANDLNLTLVVDPEHAVPLVRKLHQLLISAEADNRTELGASWADLTQDAHAEARLAPWWEVKAADLEQLMANRDCAYVYDLESVRQSARKLKALRSIGRIFYAIKANDRPEILNALAEEGISFECVSRAEACHVLNTVHGARPEDILLTPNFAPREEYRWALSTGVHLTIDNAWILNQWPEDFSGASILLRLDLDAGYGHHKMVITSGADSKFGIALDDLPMLAEILDRHGIKVMGLHAHTGSGVKDASIWSEQLQAFSAVAGLFPDLEVIDLGGGLAVPYAAGVRQNLTWMEWTRPCWRPCRAANVNSG